jgi:hypothetical protein
MGRPMGLLMCNNVLALICSLTDLKATSADLLCEKNIVKKNTHKNAMQEVAYESAQPNNMLSLTLVCFGKW